MQKTRVLLVDDHHLVRLGLKALLAEWADWEVCGEAATGREAVEAAARLRPDVVVMDIIMPDVNGLDATREILRHRPETEVLILSVQESGQIVRAALTCGARGYVRKSDTLGELCEALNAVRQHKPHFAPQLVNVLLGSRSAPDPDAEPSAERVLLSPRERQILQLVAEGKLNKEISGVLNISVKTVETHRARVMAKLQLRSVTELVKYAIRNRIIRF
ncbi:MAG TPA: response regulator transcription factor [Candidatus Sulfopaludibacter sp.]|nr:response regulator transcription factor [Candidatus Sulfopaludibacter sp.]